MGRIIKAINFLSVVTGYIVSRITRHPYHWGSPVALSIEPTNHCNLRCPECPSGTKELTRERGSMDMVLYQKILDEVSNSIYYLNLYFQGEPYMNPAFFEMVREARKKKIYVNASTNGHFLDPENARKTVLSGLSRIIISLDGTDQSSYSSYRIGGDFTRVTEGIRNLLKAREELGKRNPRIIIQFLVLRTNEHQIGEIKKLVKDLGADKLELKSAQLAVFKHGNTLMPTIEKYSRYRGTRGQEGKGIKAPHLHITTSPHPMYAIRNKLPNHCFRMWSSCVITWDGRVAPCCFDKDVSFLTGSINGISFGEIWNNKEYDLLRQRILRERKTIDICRNCTEGMGLSSIF